MKRRSSTILSATVLALALPLAASAVTPGENFLTNWDYDGDGQVTLEEVLERRGDLFDGFDADENGFLSAEELADHNAMRDAMQDSQDRPTWGGQAQGFARGPGAYGGQGMGQRPAWGGQRGGMMGPQGYGYAQPQRGCAMGPQGYGAMGPQGMMGPQGGWGQPQGWGQPGMGPQQGWGQPGMGPYGMGQPGYGQPGFAPGMGQPQGMGPQGQGQPQGLAQGPQGPQGQAQGQGQPQGMGQPGMGPQGQQAQMGLGLDTDGDGQISRDEFTGAGESWFTRFDRNGDGVITEDDFATGTRW